MWNFGAFRPWRGGFGQAFHFRWGPVATLRPEARPSCRAVQQHPQAGAEVLEGAELGGPIAEIIRQHHERLDGSGYPAGLMADDICLEARIIAVADVAEAMLAHRPYRPACTLDQTTGELKRGRGSLYDARVVDACLAALGASA